MQNIFSPSDAIKTIVKHYIVVDSLESLDGMFFLPNGGNFIIFNRGLKAFSLTVGDNRKHPVPEEHSISIKSKKVKQLIIDREDSKGALFPIIIVELEALGYHYLFNADASLLNKSYLSIDKRISDQYFNELYTHDSLEDEINYLDQSLENLYLSHNHKPLIIEELVRKIVYEDHFDISIGELTKDCECSRSTLERQFKKNIGMTPKNFIFTLKFCKTIKEYVENGYNFHQIPYLYSDQSHMNAVFQKFLGCSPGELLQRVENKRIKIYQVNLSSESSS
ncbi:MAG: helix-turn-helix domain-containing protein [Thiovulaceae bacterium]|nr:helix-turn-helix domain-containing protein [Sulfurimonadaceae bacterium]